MASESVWAVGSSGPVRSWQTPDVALQFFLAQAQRQRLQEQHQIWIQEELKRLEQEVVVAGDQVKGLVAGEKVRRVK